MVIYTEQPNNGSKVNGKPSENKRVTAIRWADMVQNWSTGTDRKDMNLDEKAHSFFNPYLRWCDIPFNTSINRVLCTLGEDRGLIRVWDVESDIFLKN